MYPAKKWLALALLCAVVAACSPEREMLNPPEYFRRLADTANGLVRKRCVGELCLTMKYLPPEYLAYKELKGRAATQRSRDSLARFYGRSLCFMLSIAPADGTKDVLMSNVESYAAFARQLSRLNFALGEYLELRSGAEKLAPVLAVMENNYELGNDARFMIVFTPPQEGRAFPVAADCDVVFTDTFFDTGIHHFRFARADLLAVPLLAGSHGPP